jgi:hypothetical protein
MFVEENGFVEESGFVEENGSPGTDRDAATPRFIVGRKVESGFHGRPPSLTDLGDGKVTTCLHQDQGVAGACSGLSGKLLTSSAPSPLRASH